MYDLLKVGNIVSFDVYASSILGTDYGEMKVTGVFDKNTANMWVDTDTLHANLYSQLPQGTPTSPDDYQFVKLERVSDKSVKVLGVPWIKENTITIISKGTLTIKMIDMTSVDANEIRKAILALNYKIQDLQLN